ncbi:hypothetical protein F5Y13DRAFT_199079 [Hypoxylon sp. FL1857]|nr:hypothetical protein F5Y13DRAFT_199079 [Hypoxylon sp. FL1857]
MSLLPRAHEPTKEKLAYMLAHKADTRAPSIVSCSIVCVGLAVAFVVLRIFSRHFAFQSLVLELSDWFILTALVFFITSCVLIADSTYYGFGRHIIAVTDVRMMVILNICTEVTYCFTMVFIKLSMLALYGRIFPQQSFRIWLWSIGVFLVAWAISGSFSAIFQCTPISFYWNPVEDDGFCINYGLQMLISSIINIITDFVILLLPVPLIWKLHTTKQKKRLLILTFALGSMACIVSLVRLPLTLQLGTDDGSWDSVPATLCSEAELMIGILAVSTPTYQAIIRRYFPRFMLATSSRDQSYAGGGKTPRHILSNHKVTDGQSKGHFYDILLGHRSTSRSEPSHDPSMSYQDSRINVEDVELVVQGYDRSNNTSQDVNSQVHASAAIANDENGAKRPQEFC